MTRIKGAERSILSFYLKLAPNQRMPNVFMLFSLWQGEPKALLFPPGLSISMPISAMFPCLEKLSIKFLTKMLIHGTPCYRVMSGFSEAMKCAFEMLSRADVRPDFHTFPSVLKACYTLLDGERLHCWVLKLGFEWDVFVAASLLHMYYRFGFAGRAYTILKDIPFRDTGCWNSMISGFLQNGDAKEALSILDDMILEGICLDSVTAATILSICAQLNDIIRGMLVHLYVIKHGLEFNLFVSNALINMYAKFQELKCAQSVFNLMHVRDTVSCNSIITAYEQNDHPHIAIKYFLQMQSNKIKPDPLTLVSLSSCAAQTSDLSCSNLFMDS
ncbi:hypothetical protein ACS0TY_017866 [Phlomoides rotata]